MERSIIALKEFVELMGQSGVAQYLAGATAVVREAGNGRHFLIREGLGLFQREIEFL